MSKKGTGIMGFADYSQPIIRHGYNRAQTDQVIQEYEDDAEVYRSAIQELTDNLELVTHERDAMNAIFFNYMKRYGIEIDYDELDEQYSEELKRLRTNA